MSSTKPSQIPMTTMAMDESRIYVSPLAPPIAYSDGDAAENYIIDSLNSTDDLSVLSVDLRKKIRDWPSEYHLTAQRANLLRHIQFKPSDRVLEIGAGCGAITRYLGEVGCRVDAVEGTYRRALAARTRCGNLDNVSIYCGNFDNIEIDNRYDYILVIGVLEYAAKFIQSDQPYHAFIRKAKSALKADGSIFVAIENRLGLKYFAGCTEDHVGLHFFGIENRYTSNTAATFGREELKQIFTECGFSDIQFDYPFPDYKIPSCVLTESGCQNENFIASELIRHHGSRDYSGRKVNSLNESLAWPSLWKNKLLQSHANSFLVRASCRQSETPQALTDESLLAVVYSTDRVGHFAIETRFLTEKNAPITVEKRLLQQLASETESNFRCLPESTQYHRAPTLHSCIIEAISRNDANALKRLIKQWVEFFSQSTADQTFNLCGIQYCNGQYFDCTPRNLILSDDGELKLIDAEWKTERSIPYATAFIRYFRLQINHKIICKILKLKEDLATLVNHFLPEHVAKIASLDITFEVSFFSNLLIREIHPFLPHYSGEELNALTLSESQRLLDNGDTESTLYLLLSSGELVGNPNFYNDAALVSMSIGNLERARQIIDRMRALSQSNHGMHEPAEHLAVALNELQEQQ